MRDELVLAGPGYVSDTISHRSLRAARSQSIEPGNVNFSFTLSVLCIIDSLRSHSWDQQKEIIL